MRRNPRKILNKIRERRKKSVRKNLVAVSRSKPRLSIFKSNRHIYAQIIDDKNSKTIVSVSDYELKTKIGSPAQLSSKAGELIADKAKSKGITEVVFDRGRFKYHGQIKSFAEGVRAGGLKF